MKYYFVSDVHLGAHSGGPKDIEKKFLRFLNSISSDAAALYLLGDIFDFWYEYKYVIPRDYTRVLGKLAELADNGLKIYYLNGNHDVWTYSYFQEEVGMIVVDSSIKFKIGDKRFLVGHGDRLGNNNFGYKMMCAIFRNRFAQILYSSLHPRWSLGFGYAWAYHSRKKKLNSKKKYVFNLEEKGAYRYSLEHQNEYDYFIFGHFHVPTHIKLQSGAQFNILGFWAGNCEYGIYDNSTKELTFHTL